LGTACFRARVAAARLGHRAESGPYAYVRNPLYLGTTLVAAGLVIASRRWLLAVLFAAVFILIYLPVIELEEQHLRHLFPDFEAYAQRVPALLPTRPASHSDRNFRWALYVRNREYQALLGWLSGMALLVAKVLVL
jgi:protein-S-isoprenylcysteine O-methyltransferase Ste14